ncbi:LSU rRNA pseudouridine synthase [Candidatus Syntrophocurvum alkaliphilum]|uniref:Pseudouridine synthase n=1 Tax=Candidatus Syntrophocurvum alkaliphilum TaxID=2293317 RepID=A0A6I6DHS5_9FIRM|nr:pseudouridine synthase [Candidatus Syntrophocurvum alkaliphilum]QGT99880.1 LSU rRNA pseudouridine synthase [Candidatus Syntrophocurvum alkaliphilum]
MRLSKYIAEAGLVSRRKAEELIDKGKVTVNGETILKQGIKINPSRDKIEVNGKLLKPEQKTYILLNKPSGYLSSVKDTHGRPTVLNLVKNIDARLYPVGRLDFDTEGLIILTNDGEFTNLMIHPKYKIRKKYKALIKGKINKEKIERLRKGVKLEDGITAPAKVNFIENIKDSSEIELTIHEGRKRQIKRMCKEVGHPLLKLERTAIEFLTTEGLKKGDYRKLKLHEINQLKKIAFKNL